MSFYNPYMKHPAWSQGIGDAQRTAFQLIMAIMGMKGAGGGEQQTQAPMQAPKFNLSQGQAAPGGFSLGNMGSAPSAGAPSFSLGQQTPPSFMPQQGGQDKDQLLQAIAKALGLI